MTHFIEAEPTAGEVASAWQIENRLRKSPAWRPLAEVKPEHSGLSGWFTGPFSGLSAAGLVAIIAAGVWFIAPWRSGDQPGDSGVTGSMGFEGLEPLGDLERFPTKLSWRPVPGAVAYEVSLLDIEEKTRWKGPRQPAAELQLPVTVLGMMASGKPLFWHIGAYDAQGRVVASSGPQRFRVVLPVAQ
jgi:hypothetical protein